jgi:hypothetical protein
MNMAIITAYAVDTYFLAFHHLLRAMASANLFLRPCEKPASRNPNHRAIEDSVSHIPYVSEETYPRVSGIRIKDTAILMPFRSNDAIMLRFTFSLRVSVWLIRNLI